MYDTSCWLHDLAFLLLVLSWLLLFSFLSLAFLVFNGGSSILCRFFLDRFPVLRVVLVGSFIRSFPSAHHSMLLFTGRIPKQAHPVAAHKGFGTAIYLGRVTV